MWTIIFTAAMCFLVGWALLATGPPEELCDLCGGLGSVVTEDNECCFRAEPCPICGGSGKRPM